ncbi:MAG: Hint domain-containing protein [Phaeovulum sp.]|uniref:Hint domain-containing protein n=1 Tax=Phaeovulum sp. TaxID=2934796 RepID=UPI00273256C0|nr:Hint domain-containing protein [Phaeovulum sp.]MDP3860971.1 Hint domain-containing protein [Phaeovulum sp.]
MAFAGERMAMARHGWLGFCQRGTGGEPLPGVALPQLLARGTLLAEFALERGQKGPLPLVHMASREGWPRLLSLALSGDGRLILHQRQGLALATVSLAAADLLGAGGQFRLSYGWDAPARQSLLTLEALDRGAIRQAAGLNPLPLPQADLVALLAGHGAAAQAGALLWLAFNDGAVPVGPGAAFAPSTPIETPDGPRPAAEIRAGDRVQTTDAGAQEVLWSGSLALPALGALAPIRLGAGRFGRSRDLWVLPQTRIATHDTTIEYLFGTESVLVEARHLVDGASACHIERPGVLTWHGILLRGHHLLVADGLHMESLYAGALAAAPELAATTALAALAALGQLPTHRRPVLRELRPYEAASLAAARARFHAPVAA